MKRLKFHRTIVALTMMLIGWLPSLAHDFEVDGIFYNKTSGKTVAVTYKGNSYGSYSNEYIGEVAIPSSVNYEGITYSVTSIGGSAFWYCSSLTSIEIPNSVTSIGNYAFDACDGLTSIVIPNSVTSIGNSAFRGCDGLTCIEIPNSVTSIGEGAFSSCDSLTSIVVDAGNTKYDSRNDCNAIIETASNTIIAGCQNTIIPNSVTSIGRSAFSGCDGLTCIEIPNSVTSIGDSAFNWCTGLTSIVVDASNTVYDSRENCNAIIETATNKLIVGCSNSKIPNSVTSIGDNAFYGCSNLTSIEIGNSVTSIGYEVFSACQRLTSVEIGNSVTSIGNYAFSVCSSLTKITCLATTPPTIKSGTFSNYSAKLYVPAGCKAAYEVADYWKNFSNIIELEPELEEGMAFEYGGLTYKVTVKGKELAVIASESGEYSGAVVIPSSVDYNGITYSVTSIGDEAFFDCSGLTSIEIPNSVTSIGNYAFSYCESLTSIQIPNSVTSIGNYAFSYCESLTSIQIPNSVTSIGYGAFYWCSSLTSIVIGNSVTSIGNSAFLWCSSLTSILVDAGNTKYDSRNDCNAIIETASNTLIAGCQDTIIPNSVTSIGNDAFGGCTSLTSIEIPNSVTSIGKWAFSSCLSLTSIEIPNSVTSIGDRAFSSCKSLTSIQIPNSVTSIGNYAFSYCESLIKITCLAITPPTIKSDTFNSYSAELYVPAGSISAYQSAIYWNNFNIKEIPTISTSIVLNKTSASLKATETLTLVATVLPENATDKSVTWKSSNEAVATVDANGKVTAVAVGEATITATTADGSNKSATCKITVAKTLATSISLDKTSATLKATETLTLKATIAPATTTDKSVTWKSSNEAVATVDANGKVTAVAVGEATITATTADGSNKSATCKITVAKTLATSISLDKTSATLKATETLTLKATVAPATTTDKSVTWKSSNEAVATVDANGKVNAVAVGEATITATTADGSNKSATCKITVAKTLATSISLDKTSATLKATEILTLKATIAPATTTDKSVTWKSSNEAVATVDTNGKVTAVAVGEATITATTADGSNKSATCKITVAKTLATSISLDKTSATLKATETLTLKATVAPATTTDKSVTWKSSNEAVATVDANGKVTAVAVGEATITATTADGSNKSATCKVTVTSTLATSITLDYTEYEMVEKAEFQLTATILPESTKNKGVVWSSSDAWVASVDENGLVRAYSVGEAVITATTIDGSNLSASCKVTVVSSLAQSITLDKTEVSLEATETAALVATVLPKLASNKSVEWSSSNEAIAVVDENGVVTAISIGEAVITATTADGSNLSASCKVTVFPTLAVSIELDQTEASVEEKSEFQLTATILPEHTTNKEVAWSSSKKVIATVDETGLVFVKSVGEVVITATTTDGSNLSATCRINVYSGIDGVNGDDVIVATIGDNIVVKNAKLGSVVNVYASNGALVASEVATDGSVVIEAPVKGVYVVKVGKQTVKVIV